MKHLHHQDTKTQSGTKDFPVNLSVLVTWWFAFN